MHSILYDKHLHLKNIVELHHIMDHLHITTLGMGMSLSPQIWQQFVDLIFQDDMIKHK